jgi:hypothetical protein
MVIVRRSRLLGLLLLTTAVVLPAAAQDAVPTTVTVRAVSNDAKLIQDPSGRRPRHD